MEWYGPCIAWLSHWLRGHPLRQASGRRHALIPGASLWTVKVDNQPSMEPEAAPAISQAVSVLRGTGTDSCMLRLSCKIKQSTRVSFEQLAVLF